MSELLTIEEVLLITRSYEDGATVFGQTLGTEEIGKNKPQAACALWTALGLLDAINGLLAVSVPPDCRLAFADVALEQIVPGEDFFTDDGDDEEVPLT